jgi:uncharacterized protein (TIGR02246 family)
MSDGEQASSSADQLAAIHDLVRLAHLRQSDTEGLIDLHTPDALVVNIAGRRVIGREAFREAMSKALASQLANVTTSTEIDQVLFIAPDVAVVSCTKSVSDNREVSASLASLPSRGYLTYVLVRKEGEWKIASAQTTPIV